MYDIQRPINRRLKPRLKIATRAFHNSVVFLPNIEKATYRIGLVFLKHKVKNVSKCFSKISLLFPSPKDRLNRMASKRVYNTPCSCDAVYNGESGLPVK